MTLAVVMLMGVLLVSLTPVYWTVVLSAHTHSIQLEICRSTYMMQASHALGSNPRDGAGSETRVILWLVGITCPLDVSP